MTLAEARSHWYAFVAQQTAPIHIVYDFVTTHTLCDQLRRPGDEAMPAIRLEVVRGLERVVEPARLCARCWELMQLLPKVQTPQRAVRREH